MTISSYTDLQTAVASWLAKSSDTDLATQIPDLIRIAEAQIRRDLDTAMQETSNTALSISTEFTALSSISTQLIKIRRLVNTTSSPYSALRFRTPGQLITDFPSSTTGVPKVFTIVAQQLQVRPIPDGTYTFECDYYKWLDPLATTSTNSLLTNYPDVYLFASLAEAAGWLGDMDAFKFYQARYAKVAQDVVDQDTSQTWGGARLTMRTDTGNP